MLNLHDYHTRFTCHFHPSHFSQYSINWKSILCIQISTNFLIEKLSISFLWRFRVCCLRWVVQSAYWIIWVYISITQTLRFCPQTCVHWTWPRVWEWRVMLMSSSGDKIAVFGKTVTLCLFFFWVHYVFFSFNVFMYGGRERSKRQSSMWCLADQRN